MSVPSISALIVGISFSACTQALTKKPMKPSFTPCFFSNSSLYSLRSAMTALMSTSLKVVSIAAVFCASFRRRAMVWRSRVIGTRSSRAASSAGDGARMVRRGNGGRLRGSALDRRQHIALQDLPVLAGAFHLGRIDARFRRELAHRGRRRHSVGTPPASLRLCRGAARLWLRAQRRLLLRRVDRHGGRRLRSGRLVGAPVVVPAF